MRRIYLDNAATSWPKPETVYAAVEKYMRECGAPAGRSAYSDATEAARIVDRARDLLAKFLGQGRSERIVFGLNGTDVLNLAIHGVVRPGDHVVTTEIEHNSVLRPLRFLQDARKIDVTYVTCDSNGGVDPREIESAIEANTRLVAVSHASNVTGAIQPISEIAKSVSQSDALMLVDAAQSVGHLDLQMDEMAIDLLATSGHKGLLGPLGTGVLAIGPRAVPRLVSSRQGGTGTRSEDDRHPDELPERLEAGNLNVPGIAGLAAGVEFLNERGFDGIRAHEIELTRLLIDGLASIDGVNVFGPDSVEDRVGVVSISVAGMDPQEVAAALDSGFHVQVRAGLHCAPRIHERLDTHQDGGTVRFGLGPFNTNDDVETAVSAVEEIAAAQVTA